MNTETIESKIKTFEQKILDNYVDESGNSFAVKDGIVNVERYLTAPHKILWIMKEVNDTDPEEGEVRGGWDLRQFMNDVSIYKNWKKTFLPIIYSTWGIYNGFKEWNNVPNVDAENEQEMLQLLQSIAFINLNKLPGGSSSSWQLIKGAYEKNKELILEQIEIINPEIIIGGGVLHYLYEDLKIPQEETEENGCFFTPSRVYIATYHPNQRTITGEAYYQNIIEPVKYWSENIKLK